MKTNKKRLSTASLALLYLILAVLPACRKDSPITKQQQNLATKAQVKAFVEKRLQKIASKIVLLSRDKRAVEIIRLNVAARFDGDNNVLTRDLFEPKLKNNKQVTTQSLSNLPKLNDLYKKGQTTTVQNKDETLQPNEDSIDLAVLETELTTPIEVNGETLYPQIYIPFYEEHMGLAEQDTSCPAFAGSLAIDYPNPVIVTYDGEEISGQESFIGHSYDANGTLIDDIVVDECFAQKHIVWAITINERVTSSGLIITPPNYNNAPITASGIDTISQAPHITDMTVKKDKESWIKGANDVAMAYAISWINGTDPSNNQISFTPFNLKILKSYNSYGFPIYDNLYWLDLGKFTNRDIRKKKQKTINKVYAVFGNLSNVNGTSLDWSETKSLYPTKGDYIYFVLFERDWPFGYGPKNVALVSSNNPQNRTHIPVYIDSYNSPYMTGYIKIVPNNYPYSVVVNTTKIVMQSNDQIAFSGNYIPL